MARQRGHHIDYQFPTKPARQEHSNTDLADYFPWIEHILHVGQSLLGRAECTSAPICDAVETISNGRLLLVMGKQGSLARVNGASMSHRVVVRRPVSFGDHTFGELHALSHLDQPGLLDIPQEVIQLMADACGCVLHILELSTFIARRSQHITLPPMIRLTPTERKVLWMMSVGYSPAEIAETFSLSPKTVAKHQQHIREKLGVHCEHDIVLAGFLAGLLSPLPDLQQ